MDRAYTRNRLRSEVARRTSSWACLALLAVVSCAESAIEPATQDDTLPGNVEPDVEAPVSDPTPASTRDAQASTPPRDAGAAASDGGALDAGARDGAVRDAAPSGPVRNDAAIPAPTADAGGTTTPPSVPSTPSADAGVPVTVTPSEPAPVTPSEPAPVTPSEPVTPPSEPAPVTPSEPPVTPPSEPVTPPATGGQCVAETTCASTFCFPVGVLPCCRPDGSCGCTWAAGAYCL